MDDNFTSETDENLDFLDSVINYSEKEDTTNIVNNENLDYLDSIISNSKEDIVNNEVEEDVINNEVEEDVINNEVEEDINDLIDMNQLDKVNNFINDLTGETTELESLYNKEEPIKETNILNAIQEGRNHALYNLANTGSYAKTFASALKEGGKGLLPFIDADPEGIHFTKPYIPEGIHTELDSAAESVSKTLTEMVGQIITTGTLASVASVVPGIGTATGGTIGTVGSSAILANSMFGESLYNNYNQYLSEGKTENEALIKAIEDAFVEGGVEFGTDVATAGIAKLTKLGISSGMLAKAVVKILGSGGVKTTEKGLVITNAGNKVINSEVKKLLAQSTVKQTSKSIDIPKRIFKGGITEGVIEEGLQGLYGTIRHRKEGQTYGEAIKENASDIGKSVVVGFTGGALGTSLGLGASKTISSIMDYGSDKLLDNAVKKEIKRRHELGEINEALSVIINDTKDTLNNKSNISPIGDAYGTPIEGNQEVNEQGETILTTKKSESTIKNNENVSIEEELEIQNDENDNSINNDDLTTTRKELADANDIDNTEEENSIPGSVSDNGYTSSEDHPIEGNGLSSKDEVPSTPQTDKTTINTHHNETTKAMNTLKMNKTDNKASVEYVDKTNNNRLVINEDTSSIHKYYGVKNFIETLGSAVVDRAGVAYNLFVKGELSNKEKRLNRIPRTVRGYTQPSVNNVIRVSNSRDYATIIHEGVHHLVHRLGLMDEELANNIFNTNIRKLIVDNHKELEKINSSYKLNEKAYEERGEDIIEEYFSNLVAAYGTGLYTPDKKVVDLIEKSMEKVGVTKEFNMMRQQFLDYNSIKSRKNGALQIAQNNMKAARLLVRKKFDTKNLNSKQLSVINKFLRGVKATPKVLIEHLINENYQIEKDAKRIGKYNDILKANQALRKSNRISNSFIKGTGVYFNNGVLRKLSGKRGIKSEAEIYRRAEALGEEYVDKLSSFLWAKQTIGESTGNQTKADNLLTLAKELNYKSWLEARKDLKLISLIYQKNLYQGKPLTLADLAIGKQLQTIEKELTISEEDTEALSKQTDLLSVDFNDTNLLNRLNNIIEYVQKKVKNYEQSLEEKFETEAVEEFENSTDSQQLNEPTTFSLTLEEKNNFIRDNYYLDKAGSVNTAMTLSDALDIYTELQNDPKIQQIESLDNDVRMLLQTLENLMSDSSLSSKMQIEMAKQNTGAWYIPLLRFIDVDEEKAIGINLKGNSFNKRYGSNREVIDIFTAIENLIHAVANNVTTNQAIQYVLALKNEPIFAQYIREVPSTSKEVSSNFLTIINNKVDYIDNKIKEADIRGEKLIEKEALLRIKDNLISIRDDILEGRVTSDDARVELFVETPPKNSNIIQTLEADGKVHYYLIDDVLKNFIYNQRKNIFNIINQSQFAKDYLGWIQKTNEVLQYIPRFTYTISNLAFLTSNISRDAMDAAIKVPEKDTTISGLKVLYRYMKNVSGAIKLICMQLSAKNREEFDTITTLFGGAEQTQYREGDYTTSYLDYKLNKKGKIVRGGILGWLETLADVLGNTDLMMRIESVDQRAKQLGLDIHEANASYDDYVSLNLPKKYLKKYITDEQIEAILGKDKANAWKETKDNEYFPYVPEEFEKEQLNNIFSDYEEEITNKFNSEIMSELQDVFDRCSIDFSKGTITSRSLGKIFLFANTRIQGGAQLLSFVNSHKKAATGSFLSLMMLGILKTLLGWSDDNPSDENKAVTGISIKNSFIRAFFPVQTAVMIPVNIGESIGRLLKSDDKSKNRSLINDLSNILWDNTLGAFTSMSGIVAVAANTPTFLISGELPNYGDEKKYNEFNYFKKKKAGINVDTLAKKTDSLLSKKLSNWLVNNGIYRFSSHEIDRFINMFLGNAEKQVEGVLGLGSIFNDKTNKIDWLNWKFDPVRDLLDGMLKPFSIKELTRSKDSDYINELAEYEMSKYDRFTGQVNTSAANRVTPDRLAEEDRAKFQKYFDRSYLAKRAINGLKIISDFASQIDKNKEGGEKAYRELVTIYKDMARFYRDFLENYDSDDNSKRSYQKYYKFIDNEIVKQNDKLTKIVEENALAKERPNLTFGWLEKDAGATETTEQDKTNAYYRSHPMTSLMESNTIDRDVSQIYDKRYGPNHLLGAALKNFINKIINNDNYKNLIKTDTFIKDSFKDTNVGASSFDSSWKILSTNKWFENEYMKFVNDEYSLENNKNKDKVPKELHSNDAVKELVFSALNHAGKNSSILSGIDKPSNNSKEYIRQLIDKLDTYGSTKGAKNRHLEELYVYGKYAKYLKDNNKNYDYEELEKIVNDYSTERKADSTNPIKEKVNGKYVWKSKDDIENLVWRNPKAIYKPTQPSTMVGNVDISNRPMIKEGDGYATSKTSMQEIELPNGSYKLAHYTIIDSDGYELSENDARQYIVKILNNPNPMEADKPENGGKGLIYKIDDVAKNNLNNAIKEGEKWDIDMHKKQDKMYRKYWEEHKNEKR